LPRKLIKLSTRLLLHGSEMIEEAERTRFIALQDRNYGVAIFGVFLEHRQREASPDPFENLVAVAFASGSVRYVIKSPARLSRETLSEHVLGMVFWRTWSR